MRKQLDIHWQFFVKFRDVLVAPWAACALSLYIDPDSMNDARTDYSVGPGLAAMYGQQPSDEKRAALEEFNKLCKRLDRYIHDPRFFTLVDGKLRLIEFVNWLRKMDIPDIPFQLRMVNPTSEDTDLLKDRLTWSDWDEPSVRAAFSYLLDRIPAPTSAPTAPAPADLEAKPGQNAERRVALDASVPAVLEKIEVADGVTPVQYDAKGPTSKQREWESRFVSTLTALKYNPGALPPPKKRGCSGVRSAVRKALGLKSKNRSFENAWDQALQNGILRYAADRPPTPHP